jgi:hypothetical protein
MVGVDYKRRTVGSRGEFGPGWVRYKEDEECSVAGACELRVCSGSKKRDRPGPLQANLIVMEIKSSTRTRTACNSNAMERITRPAAPSLTCPFRGSEPFDQTVQRGAAASEAIVDIVAIFNTRVAWCKVRVPACFWIRAGMTSAAVSIVADQAPCVESSGENTTRATRNEWLLIGPTICME